MSFPLFSVFQEAATPVVEHLDVVEQVGDGLFSCGVARAVHPFVLQVVEETFGRRVVPAVAFRLLQSPAIALGP